MPELPEHCGEPTSTSFNGAPDMGRVMSIGDEVDEVGALVPNVEGQPQGLPLPCGQLEAPESIVSVIIVAHDVHAMVSMREKVLSMGAENDGLGALAPHS
ncbi:hypothetical protein D1007_40027 [Hordeum vulgare]|nr:hypothetical protein D1007_40027 [Hordeum vulgare]